MARNPVRFLSSLAAAALLAATPAAAAIRGLTLPPSGDNQPTSITQGIGLVKVTIQYNSPDVHTPWGADRRGKIWGGLVPYGMSNLGPLGICGDQCPWRGGANENTVLTVSHDVKVQGKPLPAGSYGLHFIPGPEEWTVIFSKNHDAWGSFFYDPRQDALRVTVKPEKNAYHEWLDYEFIERKPDRATVALQWEDLQVPFTIAVENATDLYVENLRRELTSSAVFSWENWNAAARFCLEENTNLEEARGWAERAVMIRPVFSTLDTLAQLQAVTGRLEEASRTMARALQDPNANSFEIDQYASRLLAEKKNEEALKVFLLNVERHPDDWAAHFGLARGYSTVGQKEKALEAARTALKQASDPIARGAVEQLIARIEGRS